MPCPPRQDSLGFEALPLRVWVLTKYIELDADGNGGGNDAESKALMASRQSGGLQIPREARKTLSQLIKMEPMLL